MTIYNKYVQWTKHREKKTLTKRHTSTSSSRWGICNRVWVGGGGAEDMMSKATRLEEHLLSHESSVCGIQDIKPSQTFWLLPLEQSQDQRPRCWSSAHWGELGSAATASPVPSLFSLSDGGASAGLSPAGRAWVMMCDLRLVDWAKRLLQPSKGQT